MEIKVTEGFLESFRELETNDLKEMKDYYLCKLTKNNDLVDIKWLFAICVVLNEREGEDKNDFWRCFKN